MEAFKRTISLTTACDGARYRIEIDVSVHAVQRVAPELTIDLESTPADAQELSITACIYRGRRDEMAGQCTDEVLRLTQGHPQHAAIAELCEIWKRWHLGGMNTGTRTQRDALVDIGAVYPDSYYEKACKHLEAAGLFSDRGYRYGSAWLCEPLPAHVAARVLALVDALVVP